MPKSHADFCLAYACRLHDALERLVCREGLVERLDDAIADPRGEPVPDCPEVESIWIGLRQAQVELSGLIERLDSACPPCCTCASAPRCVYAAAPRCTGGTYPCGPVDVEDEDPECFLAHEDADEGDA